MARPPDHINTPRIRRLRLTADERGDLVRVLSPLARAAGLAPLGASSDHMYMLQRAAQAIRAALPDRVLAGLQALAEDRLDGLWIDGEPERDDLPGTWEGIARRFSGGLMSEWLGLAYVYTLGAVDHRDWGFDQLRLEAQLGGDGLHRDTFVTGAGERGAGWQPRYTASRFSSLACVRPGHNQALRTAIAHRSELFDRELAPWIDDLRRPAYRCELLAASGCPGAFAILDRSDHGALDLSIEAINSSLLLEQRSHGRRVVTDDAAAAAALEAFDRARCDLSRYALAVDWEPGRRLILNQREVLHGRIGSISATTDEGWAQERWMLRWNATPSQAVRPRSAPPSAVDLDGLVAELERADATAKPAWLAGARQDEPAGQWLAGLFRNSEW